MSDHASEDPGLHPRTTQVDGLTFQYRNEAEFDLLAREIFEAGEYEFPCDTDTPVILDCGSHIGLSVASIFVPELNTQIGHDLSNLFGGALLSGYGRDHELEADRLGAEYLARTDYDPQAMIRVIGVLKNQELFDADRE